MIRRWRHLAPDRGEAAARTPAASHLSQSLPPWNKHHEILDDLLAAGVKATEKKFACVAGTLEELRSAHQGHDASRTVYWCGALAKAAGDLAEHLLGHEAIGMWADQDHAATVNRTPATDPQESTITYQGIKMNERCITKCNRSQRRDTIFLECLPPRRRPPRSPSLE